MRRFKNYTVTYKSYGVSFINYTVIYKKTHCKFEWENRVRDKKKSFEWDIAKSLEDSPDPSTQARARGPRQDELGDSGVRGRGQSPPLLPHHTTTNGDRRWAAAPSGGADPPTAPVDAGDGEMMRVSGRRICGAYLGLGNGPLINHYMLYGPFNGLLQSGPCLGVLFWFAIMVRVYNIFKFFFIFKFLFF